MTAVLHPLSTCYMVGTCLQDMALKQLYNSVETTGLHDSTRLHACCAMDGASCIKLALQRGCCMAFP